MYSFEHFRNSKKRAISLGLILLVIFLSSCEKHVTPKKVSRIITEDSWVISSFTFLDSNVVVDYTNKLFGFGESGNIIIQGESGVGGHWSVGLNKKPTVLYLDNFIAFPYNRLNDDWEVLTCSDSKISLRSENGSFTNSLTLIKHEQ
jgi:hypothetical protein